jgi:hypothetical protein
MASPGAKPAGNPIRQCGDLRRLDVDRAEHDDQPHLTVVLP